MPNTQTLPEKIQALPVERIAEIEDFVEFISSREQERSLTRAAASASAPSFKPVFATLEQALIIRQLGTLAIVDQGALRKVIAEVLG